MTDGQQCDTPRCYRQAPLHVRGLNVWWSGENTAPCCVPCFLAFREGAGHNASEVMFEVRDHSLLSDDDREALVE